MPSPIVAISTAGWHGSKLTYSDAAKADDLGRESNTIQVLSPKQSCVLLQHEGST
jgi:hypothetical protein